MNYYGTDFIIFKFFKKNISTTWEIAVPPPNETDSIPETHRKHVFRFDNLTIDKKANTRLRVMMVNNIGDHVPVQFAFDPTPINTDIGIIYAAVVLLGLYIMIIWEVSQMTEQC